MVTSADSWKRIPFTEGTPIPYRALFRAEEFDLIKAGLLPHVMEDKWFVYFEDPYLYFHRSWTGIPAYRITLEQSGKGIEVTESLCSKEIVETSSFNADYQTQLLDFLISNLLLKQRKPFPLPPGLNEAQKGIFQHHISGTGYPEQKSEEQLPKD